MTLYIKTFSFLWLCFCRCGLLDKKRTEIDAK